MGVIGVELIDKTGGLRFLRCFERENMLGDFLFGLVFVFGYVLGGGGGSSGGGGFCLFFIRKLLCSLFF